MRWWRELAYGDAVVERFLMRILDIVDDLLGESDDLLALGEAVRTGRVGITVNGLLQVGG